MTYSELLAQIVNWIDHNEVTTARAAEMVTLAEAEMNRELRVRQMVAQARQDTIIGTPRYTLPADWQGGRAFRVKYQEGWIELQYLTPEQADEQDWGNGIPWAYTIEGCSFRLVPTPNAVYRMKILYYQKIPALSNSNTSNWLLTLAPDAYLWGSLAKAEAFLRNDERIPVWQQQYAGALASIMDADNHDRWSHGTMRMRAV